MTNLSLSWINRLDAASFQASSEATRLTAANLANADRWRLWRTSGAVDAYVDIDFGAAYAIGVVGLFGLNGWAAGDTIRLRLDAVTPGAGVLLDTTAIAAGVVEGYDQYLYVLAASVNARYLRINGNAASLSAQGYFQMRRAWAGPLVTLARNFDWGIKRGRRQGTEIARPRRTGAEFVDPGIRPRTISLELNTASAADAVQLAELDRVAGDGASQVLLIPNPAGDLARDPILGRLENSDGLMHRALAVHSKGLTIVETPYQEFPDV